MARNVQREFAKQAPRFDDQRLALARADYLKWMLGYLPLQPGTRVLDVAAGTGHLSRAMASRVSWVLAVDVTAEMLLALRNQVSARKLGNVAAVRCLAEALPLQDEMFDLVVSRLAFHHFEQPVRAFWEMLRACKAGGAVAIIDLVSPEDPAAAAAYNFYERKRDPSHSRALAEAELVGLLHDAGLAEVASAGREIEVSVETWLDLAQTPAKEAESVRHDLLAELAGGSVTGMRPFHRDNGLMFLQRWVVAVGRKAP